jgi:small nuclear ribonucleoprotein (snRNP)-like protein
LAFKLTTTTEFSGTLLGFDDFVSKWRHTLLECENVLIIIQTWCSKTLPNSTPLTTRKEDLKLIFNDSDYSGATSKLPKILLNGNNICMASKRVLVTDLVTF